MNILFIGMGYMGYERLKAIINLKNKFKFRNLYYFDPKVKSIKYKNYKIKSITKLSYKYFKEKNINICIISTPHHLIKKHSLFCLRSKLPISLIIEKPFGVSFKESKTIVKEKNHNQKIFIGLNYRFFSGINLMLKDIKNNKFGKISSIQINFGHGHSPKILKSWKLKKRTAGGGVILDPGIHIINLIQLICKNNIKLEYVSKSKNFWKTGIEDEATLIFSSKKIPIINLSLSIIKWKSTFEIKGNGIKGYWILKGRGRSYGPQKYITGKRWGWLTGKKQKTTEVLKSNSNENFVFQNETQEILNKIFNRKVSINPCSDLEALSTMKLINKIYES